MKSCSPGSLAQPEKPGQGSSWSRCRDGGFCSVLSAPLPRTQFYMLLTPGSILVGFVPEAWQLWKLIHILFCLRLWLPSTHSGLVCRGSCLHGWALPWEDVLWSKYEVSEWHAFSNHKEVLKFLFQDFDMSACVKSSLMPKCLMPTGFFWSWCARVSLRLLTCCLEKKQKIIRLWSVT